MNDAEENLNPTIFDVPDSTIIFCKIKACIKWTSTTTKRNALNVNTI